MNLQCDYREEELVVQTDDGVLIMPNYDNVMETLIVSNLIESLTYYHNRDMNSKDAIINDIEDSYKVDFLVNFMMKRNKQVQGLEACIEYEEYKLKELQEELVEQTEQRTIVSKTGKEFVDDRRRQQRLLDVMNFVFYMGNNKKKVLKMIEEMKLHQFLRKQFGISDIGTIAEIEGYVTKYFIEEKGQPIQYRVK